MKVDSLHSVKDILRRLPHLFQPLVPVVDLEAFRKLLDGGCGAHLPLVSRVIESLNQGRALGNMPVLLDLFAGESSLCELLDDVRPLSPDCIYGPHLLDVDPGSSLDLEDLAQDHHVVGLTPELEIDFLGEVSSQVLLDDDRELLLLEPLPFHLRQEHAEEALDVDDNELELHVVDSLTGKVAPVASLDDSGG